jgi:hypothetical protein
LEDEIFQNPFRILGDEGLKLEQAWNKEFGSGMIFRSEAKSYRSRISHRGQHL